MSACLAALLMHTSSGLDAGGVKLTTPAPWPVQPVTAQEGRYRRLIRLEAARQRHDRATFQRLQATLAELDAIVIHHRWPNSGELAQSPRRLVVRHDVLELYRAARARPTPTNA